MLLQDKHRSIKEIADDCGFSQENYFIRIFRKYFLLTPGQYRKTPMADSVIQAAAASTGVR